MTFFPKKKNIATLEHLIFSLAVMQFGGKKNERPCVILFETFDSVDSLISAHSSFQFVWAGSRLAQIISSTSSLCNSSSSDCICSCLNTTLHE